MKPGQIAPVGGLYVIVGPGGRLTGHKRLIREGGRFPPTPGRRQQYVLLGLRIPGEEALRSHRKVMRAKPMDLPNEAAGA
jgi:hypothetical protein